MNFFPRIFFKKLTHNALRFSTSFHKVLEGFDPNIPLEEAYTPPSSWYTSVSFYEKEIEQLWQKNWICVDSFLDLNKTGDFKTGNLANQPYIITKTEEEIKTLYNVCLHHGSLLKKDAKGSCENLECPYHGWTYGLDGQLIKCTSMKGIRNFKIKENKLKNINSYQHGNLMFLNFDENARPEDFKPVLANFEQSHLSNNIDPFFRNMDLVTTQNYEINCNWKIFIDNWLDGGYHVPFLHKNLNKEIILKDYKINNYDRLNIQETPGTSDRLGNYAIYSFIYPNCLIARYGSWLDVSLVFPLTVDKCLVSINWMISHEKINEKVFIQESLQSSFAVQNEDVYISELVMKGLNSNGYHKGRYVPLKEAGAHYFHKQIYQDLTKNK